MTTNQSPVTFDAYARSLQLLRACVPALQILRTVDPVLERQLRSAAQSVGQNVAEGSRRVGKDRRHLFRIALASAAEVTMQLDQAVALAYVEPAMVAEALELADRVRAMTYRLATR